MKLDMPTDKNHPTPFSPGDLVEDFHADNDFPGLIISIEYSKFADVWFLEILWANDMEVEYVPATPDPGSWFGLISK